jgi:hypothetical protein
MLHPGRAFLQEMPPSVLHPFLSVVLSQIGSSFAKYTRRFDVRFDRRYFPSLPIASVSSGTA